MADDNTLVVTIELDDGSIKQGFARIQKQGKDTSQDLSKSFSAKGIFKGITSSVFNLRNALIGLGGAFAIGKTIQAVTRAAAQQEAAVNQLNTSLRLAGEFSQEASERFQNLAREIQATSTFGDETILQFAALARNFTNTNDEAEKLTRAAVELSAATGKSLESSITNLGKTFAGLAGELGESVPALRELTAEQLKSGAALDFVLERFGGAAQAQLNTFSGVIAAVSNNFGDLLERIGANIAESPVLIGVIKEINDIFVDLGNAIGAVDGTSFIDQLIIDFLQFSIAVNDLLIRPVEIAVNVIETAFNGIRTAIQGAIVATVAPLEGLARFFAPDSDIAKNLGAFNESSKAVFQDFAASTRQSLSEIGEAGVADSIETSLQRITNAALTAKSLIRGGDGEETVALEPETEGGLEERLFTIEDAFSNFASGFTSKLEDVRKKSADTFKSIGASAVQGLGQGVGQGFAAFGRALVEGENALEAFGKAFIAAIGQQAVVLGTSFILEGVARSILGDGRGGPLIAAGAALAAFGGALSAVAGGSQGTPSAAEGGAQAAGTGGAFEPTDATEEIETEPTNQINVNVQGSVFDSDDTGLRIAGLLQEELDRSGNSILQVT